jgi:hypothetical protein
MATIHKASGPSSVKPPEYQIDTPDPKDLSVESATQQPPKFSLQHFTKEEDAALLEANPVGGKFVDPKLRNHNRRGCLKRLRALRPNIDIINPVRWTGAEDHKLISANPIGTPFVDPKLPNRNIRACKKRLA